MSEGAFNKFRFDRRSCLPYDFDSYVITGFVIQRSDHLAKTSFSDHLQYFISVSKSRRLCKRNWKQGNKHLG